MLRDLEYIVGELRNFFDAKLLEGFEYLIDSTLGKPFFVPSVDINPGRGEEGFGKVCDNPPVIILRMSEAKALPV